MKVRRRQFPSRRLKSYRLKRRRMYHPLRRRRRH